MNSAAPAPSPLGSSTKRLALILLLAYPLLLLAALWTQRSWLSAVAALDLISLLLLGGLMRGYLIAWAGWLFAVIGTALLLWRGHAAIMLLLVPVFINAGMAAFFGRTLAPGQRPLVARAILAFEGPARLAQPGVARYARSLTWAWTLLLTVQCLLMLACASGARPNGILDRLGMASPWAMPEAWANWYLHLGGFLVIGVFSVAEFAWRNWHLRHLPHDPPRMYFSKVVQNWRRILHDGAGGD